MAQAKKGFWAAVSAGIIGIAGLAIRNGADIHCMFQIGICNLNPDPKPTVSPTSTPSPDEKQTFLKHVSAAKTALQSMDSNMPVKFPMGMHHPLSTRRTTASNQESMEAIGFLDKPSGKVKNLTPAELIGLLDQRAAILYDQVSGSTTYVNSALTLDLIAYKPQTQQVFSVNSVDASDVLRDAVNAVLNGQLTENTYDTSNLPLNH